MEEKKNKVEEPPVSYDGSYTYGDYLKFEFDEMVELIRGKIFRMSPAPKTKHQNVAGNLHGMMWKFFKKKKCEVFIAPFDVILPIPNRRPGKSSDTVVHPDVCVICDPEKIQENGCFGAPDFIIEVISPHTTKKDIQLKYEIYEESLVKEYWVVYPKDEHVSVYLLQEGAYGRPMVYEHKDLIRPEIFPELEIDLAEVFEVEEDDFEYGERL
ncbi:Uma2 family endonuclease [Portibacter marinus]|uniref:Uma2 family endonuclease n=1 Tax=Portibacter marinus TaxID=2898660 RepID=UPI001F44FC30|nr:Uma2 family endonuclease [Portibacter marinus]